MSASLLRHRAAVAVVLGLVPGLGAATLLLGATTPARPSTPPTPSARDASVDPVTPHNDGQINATLNVTRSTIVDVIHDFTAPPTVDATLVVPVDGRPLTLDLFAVDLRTDGYQLLAADADGTLVVHEPGPPRTYRGTVAGIPDSRVAATIETDGLNATIILPEAGRYVVEPTPEPVDGGNHVVYHDDDVDFHGACGSSEWALDGGGESPPADGGGGVAGGPCLFTADLACDADFEYFDGPGNNSVTDTQTRIMGIINTVNLQYESEVGISFQVPAIIVRTDVNDPYTAGDIFGLLGQVTNQWEVNHDDIDRDLAELFTGRNLSGSVIGVANLADVCTSGAYSVVENIGGASCRSDLTAHELGHNWAAGHCSCPGNTMNSGLTCANTFTQGSINTIVNYRGTREFCLENACAASNETCFEAITVTAGETLFTTEFTQTDGQTESLCDENGSSQIERDLWFRYVAECNGQVTVDLCGSDYNTRLAVYEAECPNFANAAIACDDDSSCGSTSSVTIDVLDGESYFLRVGGFQGDSGNATMTITPGGGCVPAPANDACGSAGPLFEGITPFTTLGASTDGPDEGVTCDAGAGGQISNDVWYRYVPGCDGMATISLCDADYDTRIAVYQLFCPAGPGEVVACNDDACDAQSSVTFPVTSGSLFRVRVGGADGSTGSGNLNITCGPAGGGCTGDTNDDNAVDVLDLVNVILDWATDGSGNGGDVNSDGIVNVQDLLDTILAWGVCP